MTELAIPQADNGNNLAVQMDYARAVSTANLLPAAYRGKPADIMLAVGLGQSMGLSPAESLYRIDVIQGKPTASAELIAANVRKAGHKLRVRLDEQAMSATATIIRADDPDFEHVVVRDMKWAQGMGLTGKDNYKKQPLTMLQHRAVTAVARLACPEALYGVAYTADEMTDMAPTRSAGGGLAARMSQPEPEPVPESGELLDTKSALARAMYAAIREADIGEDERLPWLSSVIGRDIESTKEMTTDEARVVLAALEPVDGVLEPEQGELGADQ